MFRLDPGLAHPTATTDFFVAPNFVSLDRADLDLGGTSAAIVDVPLPGGGLAHWLLQLGKDGNAYVLDRADLGGIGGGLAVQSVSQSEIITAPAVVPVRGGVLVGFNGPGASCPLPVSGARLTMVEVTAQAGAGMHPSIRTLWCAGLASSGAPIITTTNGVSQPVVWITGAGGDGQLHA